MNLNTFQAYLRLGFYTKNTFQDYSFAYLQFAQFLKFDYKHELIYLCNCNYLNTNFHRYDKDDLDLLLKIDTSIKYDDVNKIYFCDNSDLIINLIEQSLLYLRYDSLKNKNITVNYSNYKLFYQQLLINVFFDFLKIFQIKENKFPENSKIVFNNFRIAFDKLFLNISEQDFDIKFSKQPSIARIINYMSKYYLENYMLKK